MGRKIFLLTCWQEGDAANWRFQLETPGTDTRRLFIDLQDVMVLIKAELRSETNHD